MTDDTQLKQQIEFVNQKQIQIIEKGQTYTTEILGIAYASAFALWVFARPQMTDRGANIAGLLLALSLSLFIGWEITTMFLRAINANKFYQRFKDDPSKFVENAQAYAAADQSSMLALQKFGRLYSFPP